MNRYPVWKYILIVVVLICGVIYALPNLYGEVPAVQVAAANSAVTINSQLTDTIKQALTTANIAYTHAQQENRTVLFTFASPDVQLQAKEVIQQTLGENYLVALNLAPTTPVWLKSLGATPMKLGLDLRGGVHFLLQVDVNSVLQQRTEGDLHNIAQALRDEHIRYSGVFRQGKEGVMLQFRTLEAREDAYTFVTQRYPEFSWTKQSSAADEFALQGAWAPAALYQARQETLEQAMNTLRNRVNELGISEAIVQQQGDSRVSVDLPGVQDTAQAKSLIGKTATLEFHMVDVEHDPALVAAGGMAPTDTRLYDWHGQPTLLKNQIVLRGSSIVSARSGFGEDGRANVDVRLSGMGDSLFTKTTAESIGKPMAVVYVEVKSTPKLVDGKQEISYQTERHVISVATIQSALGNGFQITGLASADEAKTLALLLRAGALPAPVTIIEERQVGPSLGKQNIHMGILSVEVGMALVVVFMAVYYSMMGIIADLALVLNLVLIVAVLSLLGATLTLPGIAGLVLTMGMAVDANVLIFERIREELRRGMSLQASIYAGYERAFVTILDANITTLIVMMILFSLGSGVVKGLAITVTIGLITSMITAIMGTRAIVNLLYGRREAKRISIGIA
ncbi:MAG: protein-export membrane protein SecD [Gammaproteobacteria bacterium RIFCSPHIGHO2_12_FULL_41_20]|nr:MAG: protein-export membrane protein SecD [Gammaproteobacteria bacterium RIFCSPHIGHO2_12_FULL_41_20]